ncbi:hypothetical protein J5X84_08365 [Streptosporangiaceae bacterium NEAU-GS5]|nr:hypothetical protein [Streptosporangiaceae bacterium NEAU-GS5]
MIRRIIAGAAIAGFATMAAPTIASATTTNNCGFTECASTGQYPPPAPVREVENECFNIQNQNALAQLLGLNLNLQCLNILGVQQI